MNEFEKIFTNIYKDNLWQSEESASGTGSELATTKEVRERLPVLLQNYEIKRVLDVGCGDFNWMKTIVSYIEDYVGIDTVAELIYKNKDTYGKDNIRFFQLNPIENDWHLYDNCDAVILKDVLCHLSFKNGVSIINNIKLSKARYLFATSNLECTKNQDIPDGEWRPVNLILPPYNLGIPVETIVSYSDNYKIGSDSFYGKTLSMWRIEAPSSTKHNGFVNPFVMAQLQAIEPIKTVDVGTGDGYWGKVIRLMFPSSEILGIELSEKWFNHCSTLGVYSNLVHEDISTAILGASGDLIIFGDVLEHIEKDSAMDVLKQAVARFSYVIINTPVGFQPQEIGDDVEETHRCGITKTDLSSYEILEYHEGKEVESEYLVFNCLIKGNGN